MIMFYLFSIYCCFVDCAYYAPVAAESFSDKSLHTKLCDSVSFFRPCIVLIISYYITFEEGFAGYF
jgi:hypothetical protein